MKAIQTIKHLFPLPERHREKVAATTETATLKGRLTEYALGTFCFLMFIALGPFAAIPAFFATFSIPRWLEEEKQAQHRA